ncbi:hypothetical protein EON79_14715 [bacterium]|nr:MAG: hypothetical protein EON79_14715 [bacterium]
MSDRVARYMGGGRVEIVPETLSELPKGGLLIRTEASGLCSGELMAWYMDRKIPHVLGHEVAGIVERSEDARFPVGARVFPHHHTPCLACDECARGAYVHCPQWRSTKLSPGGMADRFVVPAENLNDTIRVDDLRAIDAALIEPLACVVKAFKQAHATPMSGDGGSTAVIGLGFMGLLHMFLAPGAKGYDLNPLRRQWAHAQGFDASSPEEAIPAETVYVCPGSQKAFDLAMRIVRPGGTIAMFAPLPPGEDLRVPQEAYFKDIRIVHAYSCGPDDTLAATELLRAGVVRAEGVVERFVSLEELPSAYVDMRDGKILKAMVVWPET